jgi:uncharacterized phage protein gp47/JayE
MPPKLTKSVEEITSRAIRELEDNTVLSDLSPGSVARAILDIVSREMGDLYSSLDFNFTQGMLDKARGTALDALGSLLGISRKIGENSTIDASSCSFYFYVSSSADHVPGEPDTTLEGIGINSITIPAGTLVSTSGSFVGRRLAYETTDEVLMDKYDSMIYVGLKPTTVDMLLNTGKGTLTVHSLVTPSQLYCYNPKPINAIQGYEDDDSYRLRIKHEVRLLAKANRWALYLAALSTNGVKSANIHEMARGLGSVDIIISPYKVGDMRGDILVAAQTAVNDARPAGIDAIVRFPTFVEVVIAGRIVFNEQSTSLHQNLLRRQVKDTIANYVNSMGPGETIIYNRLISLAMNLSSSIQDFQITSFSIGAAMVPRRNYKPGAEQQLYAGTISVT